MLASNSHRRSLPGNNRNTRKSLEGEPQQRSRKLTVNCFASFELTDFSLFFTAHSADGAENPITGDWEDGSDDTSDDGSDDGTSAWRNRRRSQLDDPEVAHAAAEATRLALSDSDSQENFSPDPPIQTATAASTNFENTQSAQGRQESEFDAMFSDDSESDDDASWTPAASSTPAQPSSGAVVPLVVVNENSSEEDEFSGGEGGFEDQARPQQQQGPLSRQGSHYGFDGTPSFNANGDASRERKRSYNEHHQRRLEKQASSTSIGSDFGGFDSTASPQHDPEASPQEFHLPCRWTDAGFLLRNDGRKTTVGHVDVGSTYSFGTSSTSIVD